MDTAENKSPVNETEKVEENKMLVLRKRTGLNRAEFAKYFGIPYRTVQDWEGNKRKMPEYLYRLMVYKIETEGIGNLHK